ncbi:hypothetical protein JCM11491_007041 [Sporobolomyces phaffii]
MMSHLPAAALALALLSVLASVARGQTINSPASLEVCAPQQILVNGGTPPVVCAALPGGATGGQVLSRISTDAQQGSVTWTVDVPAGEPPLPSSLLSTACQNVTLAVRDSTGATGYSSQIPVLAGVSDACLATDAAVSADATSRPESSAAPSSLSSSASFDEASVSSLIDSLTRFTPPGGVEPTMLPSMTSHSETTGRVTPMDTPLLPTSRTTLAQVSPRSNFFSSLQLELKRSFASE